MSDLIVEVCTIDAIRPHPNADSLSIAVIKGWQVCFNHEQTEHSVGDPVIYIPPDTMVPTETAINWGVEKYLSFYKNRYPGYGKVKQVKLRGEMSYGFMIAAPNMAIGTDMVEVLDLKKWEPPITKGSPGDMETPCNNFPIYTGIQNWRNFPDIIGEGEDVVVTEKLHGTNFRCGLCWENVGDQEPVLMIGTHRTRRKLGMDSMYEAPLKLYPAIEEMLQCIFAAADITNEHPNVVLYGEIYGCGVQDLQYGLDSLDFRAFDIKIDDDYMDYETYRAHCLHFDIPTVPLLFRGEFDYAHISGLASGKTTMLDQPGKKDLLEGIVIKPQVERQHPKLGRVILKMISDDYLLRRDGSEKH